jgi:hypothetical protein
MGCYTGTTGRTPTHIADFGRFTELFFERMIARAQKKCELAPLFIKAAKDVQNSTLPNP